MDPLTIAIIASMVVSTGTSIYSSIKGGNAQKDAAERQAAIDEKNQAIANESADIALHDATVKAGRIGTEGSQLIGRQRVAAASGNVDVGSGSAAEAQVDAAVLTSYQKEVALLEGARTAYGYRSQGLQFGATAASRRATGGDLATAGYLGALGTALAAPARAYATGKQLGWWQTAAAPAGG